ncbi:BCCT family transporter [Desulfitibacter alkalitolerans]|uniref:BCCT family transporter n=1 Tax=Desulfitibacter alkalitolerans TaxID=264641 RepID=UPI0006885156|nr:BCCT family transporter [Desulfitibacter alkalitolerans]
MINSKNSNDKGYSIRWAVLLVPLAIFGFLFIMGVTNEQLFVSVMWGFFESLMVNVGWLVSLGSLSFVIFAVVLMIHPLGKIKLGGKDAKPEFKTWHWWAMSLCAGIAIGIVFWPPEALIHSAYPPRGMFLEPDSHEAIVWAMRTTFLHWTFTPYAIYVVAGVLIAYAAYNLKRPLAPSSALYPLLGERSTGLTATVVDAITLFAIVGGTAGSLGYGLMQLGAGFEFMLNIPTGPTLWIALCAIIVIGYTISSITGLNRGIKWLSDKNAWLFIGLMAFAFIFGPTAFILNLTTQSAGAYVNNFFEAMTFTDPFPNGDLWPQWWDMYWYVDWLSFAPIVGMFLARLAYGRTLREFFMVNMVLPALFGIAWFGVFGSLIIHGHYYQGMDYIGIYHESGIEILMLRVLELLPLVAVIRPILMITIFISFITLADSMTSTVSMLSISRPDELTTSEPPVSLKLFWGLLTGATAIIFLVAGGLEGVKIVKTIAGIPILFIQIAMMVGFIVYYFRGKVVDSPGAYNITNQNTVNKDM